MKILLYRICQCTWGCLQTLLGLCLFLLNDKEKHYSFHGAIITRWNYSSSVSLGMFVFLTKEDPSNRLLVHEYGHTVQSLILGPLFLIVIGIPSLLWAGLPYLHNMRKKKQISYFSFYTEHWADAWGKWALKGKSVMDQDRLQHNGIR